MDESLIYAHSGLDNYAIAQWPEYRVDRHHDAIIDHLEAVESGEISRLMIFLPPRHGKTLLASQFFPAWYLGRNPTRQVIAASYSETRAGDVGREVRNQLIDPLHGQIFEDCHIDKDSASVHRIGLHEGGAYFSVGIKGAIVGRGAHLFLIDDPIKSREEAESETFRESIKDWYKSVAYTRLMKENAIVLIQTRWHKDDLAGWLLREHRHENWTVLRLPAIAEPEDMLGRKEGEVLWPWFQDLDRLHTIRRTIGTREWSSQYQQRPVSIEGALINLNDFIRYDKYGGGIKERVIKTVQSWDTANKDTPGTAYSCCQTWKVTKNMYYLWDVFRKRLKYPELKRMAKALHNRHMADVVLIEDKASGQSLIQELKESTRIPVIPINPVNSKIVRFDVESAKVEAGRVALPMTAPWLAVWEEEIAPFPYSVYNDQADAFSQFLGWVEKKKYRRSGRRYYK
ncbi:MAG TPA: phage terminase large subunit [Desulfatiglandales bacterium]|nr:phage terminase large subunit [Desulfatiglandales bacterium]